MTSNPASLKTRLLAHLNNGPVRFPGWIIALFLLLSVASGYYTANHLVMNTNTSDLLADDLPFVRIRAELDRAFPKDAGAFLVVVESPTPEQTAMAAQWVNRRLNAEQALFQSSYIPVDNGFFRQQGLLFLALDELEALSNRLIDAQPFIGYLSAHYHFAGLTDIIGLAVEGKERDLAMPLDPLLDAFATSMNAVRAGNHQHLLSWQTLLAADGFGAEQTRRLVVARPHLDFQELLPAQKPMGYLRNLQQEAATQFPGVSLNLTGEVALEHEEMETVNQDMLISGAVSLVLVLIALFIGLRSLRLLFATFVCLVVGLILTAGFATVAVGHLNLISIAFAVLYIGLGVDFATHFCLRYQECRQQGESTDAALIDSMNSMGKSLFMCAMTTMLGFLAFVPTDFRGVSELGIISSGGILIGLVVSLTLLPAILKWLPIQPLPRNSDRLLPQQVYLLPFRHSRAILIGAVAVTIAAGFSLTHLTFDSSPINLRYPNAPSVIAFKQLLKSQTDSPFATSALTGSLAEADALAAKFGQLSSVHEAMTLSSLVAEQQEAKLEILDHLNLIMPVQLNRFAAEPASSDVRAALLSLQQTLQVAAARPDGAVNVEILNRLSKTIADFVQHADAQAQPAAQYARLENSVLKLLPHTMLMLRDGLTATAFTIDDIPPEVREHWVGKHGEYRVLAMPAQDLNDTQNLKVFVEQILATEPNSFGLPIGDVTTGQAVVTAFVQAFSAALVMIVVFLLLQTRSGKTTCLILLPLLLAALLTAAVNVWLSNPFNFANIIVLPLLLGMGVDSAIHIVHRMQHHDDHHALLQSSSARGVFFSALTTFCSFSSLAFNNHAGTASMGLLLAIGISLTVICSLLVLPAMAGKPVE
ncbi:MAG: MMPL family transporter [Methylomonas sp.]|nr:MMPL family transporter [Methylomonas sp.]PPD21952.1 MAG: hopanoid biosynthesis-associated RND transporter HpnN [Methylomonas sp.]PPD25734.1 MAG: hopanoid biosynthesis-associated RND transporter HpnN [Methylomonas sp.]PPD36987.1 MAG: hopanoid biosynthesis-associated RND transporter HpnN [Methylomonas sp.]PPD39110.1 MAG: hopanoid biosynthesis-associated RND transporter HpnN [Methylomonas sp.]